MKRGRKPKPRAELMNVMVSAQVDAGLKRNLDDLARERCVPVAHLIREALRTFVRTAREKQAA